MGEGEVCGVAVEGAMDVLLTVDVIKERYCEWPRLEDDEAIMVAGSYRPLEDAFRIAHTQLIGWIAAETGLSVMDTYQLVTQASRSPIANVCDANYTIVATMPKRYLPDVPWMGGMHAAPARDRPRGAGRRYRTAVTRPRWRGLTRERRRDHASPRSPARPSRSPGSRSGWRSCAAAGSGATFRPRAASPSGSGAGSSRSSWPGWSLLHEAADRRSRGRSRRPRP